MRQRTAVAAQREADKIAKQLAAYLGRDRIEPASPGEIEWLVARSGLRGTPEEPVREEFPDPLRSDDQDLLRGPVLVHLRNTVIHEGGDKSDEDRPRYPSYVRVDSERGSSYQTFLALSRTPASWEVPDGGGEMLATLDQTGIPVDWCVRIQPVPNPDEQAKIQRKLRQLLGQEHEYDGLPDGTPADLQVAVEDLRVAIDRLSASKASPGMEYVPVIGIGASSLAELEDMAEQLRATFKVNEYHLHRPIGHQRMLWSLMQPGSPLPLVAGHYTHHGLPEDVAGYAPLTGSSLGDPTGALLGTDIDSDLAAPVLFSASYGPSVPSELGGPLSGNIGMCGKARGGKSQTAKEMCRTTVAEGNQVLSTDRTQMGEWAHRIAGLMPGRAEVVEVRAGSTVRMDPMRMFRSVDERVRYTTGFLTLLAGVEPRSHAGGVLEDVVYAVAKAAGSLADVVEALDSARVPECDQDEARRLAGILRRHTRKGGLAEVAFGGGRTLDLSSADYICFWVPDLRLPTERELDRPGSLLPEHVLSVALLYLIACVKRSVAFSDRSRFSLIVIDEAWYLARFAQGQDLLLEVAKNGPKENAGLLLIAHLPSEIHEQLSDLLGVKLLFRMDPKSAVEGLEWLGKEPTQTNIDQISERARKSGECLMRDRFHRTGLLRIHEPPTAELRDAFDTSIHARPPAPPLAPAPRPVLDHVNGNGHRPLSRRSRTRR